MQDGGGGPGQPVQRTHSIRLRRKRDEVKQQFVKNRRSGEFGYRVPESGTGGGAGAGGGQADTLDPGSRTAAIAQNNLRPLIRSKYRLTDFGLIDTPGPGAAPR